MTFWRLALVKSVFYKSAPDKSAFGMLILVKSIPENSGLYKLIAVIEAAALFYINLLVFDYLIIFIII